MKKLFCLSLSFLTLLGMCGCGTTNAPQVASTDPTNASDTPSTGEVSTPPDRDPAVSQYANTKWDGKTLKVLCVGNSFARNATKVLYQIAEAHGVDKIVLGVLFIGGCSVQRHWSNAQSGDYAYTYYKNTTGTWDKMESVSMIYGLQDEQWDVITITQGQGQYGIPSSYDGCLEELVGYLAENKTNPDAQIAFHMTWAFPSDSTNGRFNYYANNQQVMFQCLVDTAQDRILPVEGIDFLLPSGSAIQNARSVTGEIFFAEDKFHLGAAGEYIAGYTWFAYLTGQPIDELKYIDPSVASLHSTHEAILKAVNAALADPFTVTDISK